MHLPLRITTLITLCSLLTLLTLSPSTYASSDLRNSIFKIHTTANQYNFLAPYQAPTQFEKTGTGFLIAGNKIITNAHVVNNNTQIQVRKSNDTKRYTATVQYIGEDCDLAILTVKQPELFQDMVPLELGDMQTLQTPVTVYGFPVGGTEITITEGVISRLQMIKYVNSGAELLSYQIDASVNPGASGGPVIANDKVVGVVHQVRTSGQNINYAVPIEILKHFLKDTESGTYKGFPTWPRVYTQNTENTSLRKYFKLSPTETGVRITQIASDSYANSFLKPNDIIKTMDGVKIQNDGNIVYEKEFILPAYYLITKKYINDTVRLEILREGKSMTIDFPIKRSYLHDTELLRLTNARPKFYILGGLVFEPYTNDYFTQAKGKASKVSISATKILNEIFTTENVPKHVVLAHVLMDDINSGYVDLVHSIISKANGKTIFTLEDLIQAIESNTSESHILTTDMGEDIIFYKNDLQEASKQIFDKYQIYADRYL